MSMEKSAAACTGGSSSGTPAACAALLLLLSLLLLLLLLLLLPCPRAGKAPNEVGKRVAPPAKGAAPRPERLYMAGGLL
jgi:hypothetical protein